MTSPAPAASPLGHPRRPLTLAQVVAAERAAIAAGTAKQCGYTCHEHCHGLTCHRSDPHTVHSVDVHVNIADDGTLTQWHPDGCVSDGEAVARRAAWDADEANARVERTRALASNLDLATLRRLLAAADTTPIA